MGAAHELPQDWTPPPRSLIDAQAFTNEAGQPVFRLTCDCAAVTDYVVVDAERITEPREVAFTCGGCQSVRWVTIGPAGD